MLCSNCRCSEGRNGETCVFGEQLLQFLHRIVKKRFFVNFLYFIWSTFFDDFFLYNLLDAQ